jgi:hypothetical protein
MSYGTGPHTNAFYEGTPIFNLLKCSKYFTSNETQYSCLRDEKFKTKGMLHQKKFIQPEIFVCKYTIL